MKNLISLIMFIMIFLLILYISILQNYILELEENILIFNNTIDINTKFDIDNINNNNNKILFPKYLNLFNIISGIDTPNNMIYCKSYFSDINLNYYQNKYLLYNNLTSIDKLYINMPILSNINITPELQILENAFYMLEQNSRLHAQVLEDIRIILDI